MGKIALGFGNNTDYEIIWDLEAILKLIKTFNLKDEEITFKKEVKTERDLLIAMLFFLKNNTGGEVNIKDTNIINNFSSNFKYKITIGGTCPRSAIAMNILDYKSSMHLVVLNDKIKNLIPDSINYICSNKEPNYDIHLIFQYPRDVSINYKNIQINTKRENRIIIGNNNANSIMNLSPSFFENYVKDSKVLLISGFNTMEDLDLLKNRLIFVKERISKLKEITVFYEDACFISDKTNQMCKDILFDYVNIFSFNEDEFISYCSNTIDLLNPKQVLSNIENLYKKFKVETIVIHSKYWAITYGKNSIHYKKCLRTGINMATSRFRFGDNFIDKTQYYDTENLEDDEISKDFTIKFNNLANNKGFCIASKKVFEKSVTTVGLGDFFVGGFIYQLSDIK
ncbi:MAG: ADP-dependent glucokinase/phosphofructokinase [Pleomorphochaeta sp.]